MPKLDDVTLLFFFLWRRRDASSGGAFLQVERRVLSIYDRGGKVERRVSFDGRGVVDAAPLGTAGDIYVACEVTGDDTPTAVGDCDISAPATASERGSLSRKSRRSAIYIHNTSTSLRDMRRIDYAPLPLEEMRLLLPTRHASPLEEARLRSTKHVSSSRIKTSSNFTPRRI